MSTLKVDQLEAATASTITVPSGQTLDISSATLTPPAAMPASSGVNLTALNATQLTSGAVPVAQMPAGSVIQTSSVITGTTSTNDSSPTDHTFFDSVVTGSITPLIDDSSIIISSHFSVTLGDETNGDIGFTFRWKKVVGSTTTYPTSALIGGVNAAGYGTYYTNDHDWPEGFVWDKKFSSVDSDVDTTSAVTYTLQYATYQVDNTFRIGGNGWNNFQWNLYFQEIKR
jgi:hypothetical protein